VSRVETGLRRFEGAAALVTGASSGIGLATAERLAEEGANLCLVAAPEHAADLEAVRARLERNAGVRVVAVAGDIAEPETSEQAVRLTTETFGRLDHLVDNVGIYPRSEVFDTTLEVFDEVMRVNVRGMFLAAMAAARVMAAAADGERSMVVTASTASFMGEEEELVYSVSKGAVTQLARGLAVALAPYGIRVNAVAPGWVNVRPDPLDPVWWSRIRARIPLDRRAEPEEIASVIAYLLSRDASYVSGAVLVADGGYTAGWRKTDWAAVPQTDLAPRSRP
jgi:NAD(P)-dependent dehydrogenase (short-subunit alcohol dehydrogenase family)